MGTRWKRGCSAELQRWTRRRCNGGRAGRSNVSGTAEHASTYGMMLRPRGAAAAPRGWGCAPPLLQSLPARRPRQRPEGARLPLLQRPEAHSGSRKPDDFSARDAATALWYWSSCRRAGEARRWPGCLVRPAQVSLPAPRWRSASPAEVRADGRRRKATSWPCVVFTPGRHPLEELAVQDRATGSRGCRRDTGAEAYPKPTGLARTACQVALAVVPLDRSVERRGGADDRSVRAVVHTMRDGDRTRSIHHGAARCCHRR